MKKAEKVLNDVTIKAVEEVKELPEVEALSEQELKEKLIDEITSQIEQYNEMSALRKIAETVILSAQIKTSLEKLKESCAKVAYGEFAQAEIPMVAAVRAFRYESYTVKEKVDKLTGISSMELKTTNPIIDVLAFDDFCNRKACVNPEWRYKAEQLHCAILLNRGLNKGMTVDQVKSLRNNYVMSAMAKKVKAYEEVASNPDPTSYTSLIKALQEIVNDMIGKTPKHKIQKKDVVHVLECYTREGDDCDDVKLCARKDFARLAFKVCSKLETKGCDSMYRDIIAKSDTPKGK